MNSLVRAVVRLCTATGTPRRAMLRARFAPITARPVTPMRLCPVDSVIALPRGWLRASFPRSAPPVKHVAGVGSTVGERTDAGTSSDFAEIGRGDIELAGGKGANLGELTRAGLPVPPGFVVTTAAYRAFVAANGLDEQILDARPAARRTPGPSALRGRRRPDPDAVRRRRDPRAASPRRSAEAYAAAGRRRRSPCARRPPPRTWRAPASPASRTPTSTSAATRCSARCETAGRRCGRPGPWPTGPARASTRRRSAWPWSCRRWSTPTRPGCCSPPTRPTAAATRRSSAAAWGLGESVVGGLVDTDDLVVEQGERPGAVPADRRQGGDDRSTPSTAPSERPVPAERRTRPVLDDAGRGRAGRARRPDRGALRRPAGHRVGARRTARFFIVQSRPITALPEPDRPDPDRLDGARPDGVLLPGQHRRAAARPAHAAVRRPVDGSVTRSLQALFREFLGQRRGACRRTSGCPPSTATPTTATAAPRWPG